MLNIIIQIDTREKNTKYINDILIDKRRNKDGVKIIDVEYDTVKPNTSVSTGDVSFKYNIEGTDEWIQSSFCIELKKGMDMFSSIYTKANFDRLKKEIDRAYEDKVDFYFVSTNNIEELNKLIMKVRRFNESSCKIFFDKYIELNKYLASKGYCGVITSGEIIPYVIRRLIKKHIHSNKKNMIKKYKI